MGINGATHTAGDAEVEFSVQSVSKPFVFAMILQILGAEAARQKREMNSTSMAFNSVVAIELNQERTMNPIVNAGAIAATSLAPGKTAQAKSMLR